MRRTPDVSPNGAGTSGGKPAVPLADAMPAGRATCRDYLEFAETGEAAALGPQINSTSAS